MKIWLERIPEQGAHYEGCLSATELGFEGDRFCRVTGDLAYVVHAQRVSGELVVRGSFTAPLNLRCSRCSEFFSTTAVDSDFLRAYSVSGETDSIDITGDLREALLLQVPAYPVCAEECKGLCAQCGANLNGGPCRCVKEERPNQWSILDNLNL